MTQDRQPPRLIGRYALCDQIAAGGMATVHLGRLLGPVGFSRTVAIKRLHPHLSSDPEFVAMFLDEARLVARIQHPNVVATLDVVAEEGELFLVMEYVQGVSLSQLLRETRATAPLSVPVIVNIMSGVLHGLHAAHEARDERGEPLGIVHRDISPQNLLIGVDGVARVLDFGVAKAAGRAQLTREGQIKGKVSYMAPEQLTSKPIDRRTDVFALSIVLWEALAGRRLFQGRTDAENMYGVLEQPVDPPSAHNPDVKPELDAVVLKGLERKPENRFATAQEMALALGAAVSLVPGWEVARAVEQAAGDQLADHKRIIKEIESISSVMSVSTRPPQPGLSRASLSGLPPGEGSSGVGLAPPARRSPFARAAAASGAAALVAAFVWAVARPAPPAPAAAPAAAPPVPSAGHAPAALASSPDPAAAPPADSAQPATAPALPPSPPSNPSALGADSSAPRPRPAARTGPPKPKSVRPEDLFGRH